jgi:recombination protein RecR
MMNFSSQLITDAVTEFTKLPGIGQKTALRLVLHLLKQPEEKVQMFSAVVKKMREEIKYCKDCHNYSDVDICAICASNTRDRKKICVVENIRDVIAIENTSVYSGLYHVLGGVISPVDGIGPDQLNIQSLLERIEKEKCTELIMALNPNMEGDTTLFFISKKLKDLPVKITSIARGVAFGGELEYTDDLTLARSFSNRLPFENYLVGG